MAEYKTIRSPTCPQIRARIREMLTTKSLIWKYIGGVWRIFKIKVRFENTTWKIILAEVTYISLTDFSAAGKNFENFNIKLDFLNRKSICEYRALPKINNSQKNLFFNSFLYFNNTKRTFNQIF